MLARILIPAVSAAWIVGYLAYQTGHIHGQIGARCEDMVRRYPTRLVADPGSCADWVDEAKAAIAQDVVARCLEAANVEH